MLKPAPATVEPDVVMRFEPVRLASAPSVIAPAYVWLPLVVTAVAFRAMSLAVTFSALKLTAPTTPPKTNFPLVVLALMFRVLEAATSASSVLANVMMALAPLAARLALVTRVKAPAYVWLPVVLILALSLVVPLTLSTLTALTSPPTKALPLTFKVLAAPAMVEPVTVVTLEAVKVVPAPNVTAPAYV